MDARRPVSIVSTLIEIPHIESSADISFNVVSTISEKIHLVYNIEESGISYMQGDIDLSIWSKPISISERPIPGTPYIFYHNSELAVIWWDRGLNSRRSNDDGQNWSRLVTVNPELVVSKYSFLQNGGKIYYVFTNTTGIYFLASNDLGTTWDDNTKSVSHSDKSHLVSKPTLVVHEEKIFIAWSQREKLFYSISSDSGNNWTDPEVIESDRTAFGSIYKITSGYHYPKLALCSGRVILLYEERGLFYNSYIDHEGTWNSPRLLSRHPIRGVFVYLEGDCCISFISEKYKNREWWASIPGYEIVSWDKYPCWANNDLMLINSPVEEKEATSSLLTPDNSFVSYVNHDNSYVNFLKYKEKVHLLWSGREGVKKHISEKSAVHIFFTQID